MKQRTPEEERRSALRLTIVGVGALVLSFVLWWLVESTNREGEHDAELLPLFALIPLLVGLFRLYVSRPRR